MSTTMNPQEVATEFFGGKISYWKVLRLAKSGEIPCIKMGSRYLFNEDSLIEWRRELEQNRN